ncbi:hypothetical protein J6590_045570 [Homalodisca vitripennis]|nr:hypothetical protein J6590_045570 [Homalodisca vitripennis]
MTKMILTSGGKNLPIAGQAVHGARGNHVPEIKDELSGWVRKRLSTVLPIYEMPSLLDEHLDENDSVICFKKEQ